MMRVGVVGINHKLADLKLREKLAKACQKWFGAAYSVPHLHHFVVLSTCNRTEVYFSSDDLADTHTYILSILRQGVEEDFDHKLYSYFGIDCFTHLARVTSGLDSAIVAETEIQGQVKSTYEATTEFKSLPKELHFLFQKSLGIAKKVRSELNLGRGMPNLEQAIFNTGKHFFQDFENVKILFVGASEINLKILSHFKMRQLPSITICNRTHDQALEVAKLHNTHILNWEALSNWHLYEWIIFGTKSPDYLITSKDIPQGLLDKKLMMDLCVPRNVEPKLTSHPAITLLNIDQINRLVTIRNRRMDQSLSQAEEMIFDITREQIRRYLDRESSKISPLVAMA